MNKLLPFPLLFMLSLLILGCVLPDGKGDGSGKQADTITDSINQTNQSGVEENQTTSQRPEAQPFSAREGLPAANRAMALFQKNGELVGISGTCGEWGKAFSWNYEFESLPDSAAYSVLVVSTEVLFRDSSVSLRRPIGNAWVDSTEAAKACGAEAGEFSLEMQGGSPVWVIVSDEKVCIVNATSGKVI